MGAATVLAADLSESDHHSMCYKCTFLTKSDDEAFWTTYQHYRPGSRGLLGPPAPRGAEWWPRRVGANSACASRKRWETEEGGKRAEGQRNGKGR